MDKLYLIMNFGIYISKGNNKLREGVSAELSNSDHLPFLILGERETLTSSSKERLTDSFSSYLSARFFVGFFGSLTFFAIPL